MRRHYKNGVDLLLVLLLLVTPTIVQAISTAQLKLSADHVKVRVGQTMIVEVLVKNAPSIYGVDVHMVFDPHLVEVVDADATQAGIQLTPGDFLDPTRSFLLQHQVNNAAGTIDYALTLLNPAPPAQGNGRLLRMMLRAKGEGQTVVAIKQGLLGTQTGEILTPELDQIAIRIASAPGGSGQAVVDDLMETVAATVSPLPLDSLSARPEEIAAVAGMLVAVGGWLWLRRLRRR